MTSFNLNCLFKERFSKHGLILKSWGLGLQHTKLGWGGQLSL